MTDETGKRIACAAESILSCLRFITFAIMIMAGQLVAANLNHWH
jgi:hypothetical protein